MIAEIGPQSATYTQPVASIFISVSLNHVLLENSTVSVTYRITREVFRVAVHTVGGDGRSQGDGNRHGAKNQRHDNVGQGIGRIEL